MYVLMHLLYFVRTTLCITHLLSLQSNQNQHIMTSTTSCGAVAVPEGTKLTITLPDDFHHHFRDGPATANVLEHATQQFGRAIAMPNLKVRYNCFWCSGVVWCCSIGIRIMMLVHRQCSQYISF